MKTKLVYNPPKGGDIKDYTVQTAELGSKQYSINVGEKVWFPEFVADYLCKIYPFLKVEEEKEEVPVTETVVKKVKKPSKKKAKKVVSDVPVADEKLKKEIQDKLKKETVKSYKCKQCNKSFGKPILLATHVRKSHKKKK